MKKLDGRNKYPKSKSCYSANAVASWLKLCCEKVELNLYL
uniref:Uncharacterized protein n=1 Tax=Rhizophora mucronata TaxID=61149 RepID=A0A2P2Q7R9_RHIMU